MAISPQWLTIYLYSAHRAVIFAIAQLSCNIIGQSFDGYSAPLFVRTRCLFIVKFRPHNVAYWWACWRTRLC